MEKREAKRHHHRRLIRIKTPRRCKGRNKKNLPNSQLNTSAAAAPMNPKKGATASPAHEATMVLKASVF